MLSLLVPPTEVFDETQQRFVQVTNRCYTLSLEHSLVSLSKWEMKWKKPFLGEKQLDKDALLDYIRCMTLTQNVPENVYKAIGMHPELLTRITKYIEDPMTATTITEHEKKAKNREIVTSEIIYYMMIELNIPVEFQKWHLNRLLTLIRVINLKQRGSKKMSPSAVRAQNKELNALRRARLKSRG